METKPCARCGRPSAIEIEGTFLCEDCYHAAGSCCLEFGVDDLSAKSVEPEEPLREAKGPESHDG